MKRAYCGLLAAAALLRWWPRAGGAADVGFKPAVYTAVARAAGRRVDERAVGLDSRRDHQVGWRPVRRSVRRLSSVRGYYRPYYSSVSRLSSLRLSVRPYTPYVAPYAAPYGAYYRGYYW